MSTEPVTAGGRDMHWGLHGDDCQEDPCEVLDGILAIEKEARRLALEEVKS